MLTLCDPEYCIIVILIAVLVPIRLKVETLVALFLIHEFTSKSFHLKQIVNFLESNRITNRDCSDQIFAWSNQIPGVVKSRFKSNCNLDLPKYVYFLLQ